MSTELAPTTFSKEYGTCTYTLDWGWELAPTLPPSSRMVSSSQQFAWYSLYPVDYKIPQCISHCLTGNITYTCLIYSHIILCTFFIPYKWQSSTPSVPKYSTLGSTPPNKETLNSSLLGKSKQEVAAAFDSRGIAAVAVINGDGNIQYAFAPHVKANMVYGVAEDRRDVMSSITAIEHGSIFGFASTLTDKSKVPQGSITGDILSEDLLHHTTFEGQGRSEVVIHSVPKFFLISNNSKIITGSIRDQDFVSIFEDEYGQEGKDWINAMLTSFQYSEDVNTIFENIKGQELTYVSSRYDELLWATNYVTCSIVSAGDLPTSVVQALSRNLGISTASHTAGIVAASSGQASLPTTVTILDEKEKDKAMALQQIKYFYKALFLTGNVNFAACTIEDARLPYLGKAFEEALKIKSVDIRAKALKRLLTNLVDHDASDLTLSSSNHKDHFDRVFLTLAYVSDPMARALASGRFADTLLESPDSDASSSKIDAYSLLGQLANSEVVRNAMKADAEAEDEQVHEQHETYMSKKKDKVEKLGAVENARSPISQAVNLRSLSTLAVSETGNANQTIYAQVFTRIASIFSHNSFQVWAAAQEKNQPQLPHLMARWNEEILVLFVKAANALPVVNAVEGGDASAIPLRFYTAILRRLQNFEQKVQDHVSGNTFTRDIPPTCPAANNPDAIKEKKRRLEIEHQVKAALATKVSKKSSNHGSPANGTPDEPTDDPPQDTTTAGSGGSDRRASSNGGRGGAGRGGRGRGRGGGRGGRGGVYAGSNPNMGSIFVSPNFQGSILPTGLAKPACVNWICMGKSCRKGWGECNYQHVSLDRMNHDLDDKKKICDHVANTEGLWFNKASVKSLTEQLHKAKLGGPDGPGTD